MASVIQTDDGRVWQYSDGKKLAMPYRVYQLAAGEPWQITTHATLAEATEDAVSRRSALNQGYYGHPYPVYVDMPGVMARTNITDMLPY